LKIHPRISGINYSHNLLAEIIVKANELDLGILLCTYFWNKLSSYGASGIHGLYDLLRIIPEQKIILMHGGCIHLLELAEISRQFPNILLDLSFTIIKYEFSSVDLDIQYLFRHFDRRICIGSDSPEFHHSKLRERFDTFSLSIEKYKAENIAYKNLMNYFKIYE